MTLDLNVAVQGLISLIVVIIGFVSRRTLKEHDDLKSDFSKFKMSLPEEYVPRREIMEIQKHIRELCGRNQSDSHDTKMAIKDLRIEMLKSNERLHSRVDEVLAVVKLSGK